MSIEERADGLFTLRKIIFNLVEELNMYAKKEDSKQFYIDKQNYLIKELTTIYNSISELQYYHYWLAIEAKMLELNRRDSCLAGHTIQLRTREEGDIFSLITVNPYGKN